MLKGAVGDSLNGVWIGAKVQYGSVIPHSTSISYLLQQNIVGANVQLLTGSHSRHYWEQAFRYPRYGLGYNFINLGNPEQLGNIHAVYGLIDIPFHKPKDRWRFTYQIDFGVSYFTKAYQPYENPLNHIVSSPFNVYVGLDLSAAIRLGNNHEVLTSLDITHCSNGKIKSPNKGINLISVSAGYNFSIKPYVPIQGTIRQNGYRRHYFEIISNIGGKRDDLFSDKVYLAASVVGDYYYSYSPRYSVGIGVDGMYDATVNKHEEYHMGESAGGNSNYQVGAHAGFRVRYGKMYILLNAGHYLYHNYLLYSPVYSRIGLRYALTESILVNLTLKAHKAVADYIEWGVGYRFKTKGK